MPDDFESILRHTAALPALSTTFQTTDEATQSRRMSPDTVAFVLCECCVISDARPPTFCPSVYIHDSLPAAAIPLSLFSPFLSSPSLSLLHCPPAGCMQAMQHTHRHARTHTHTHTQSKFSCVLPSTDARRITVREITVNICTMNMMRLAERRRGG